jgi:hypothetical protein
MLHGLGMLLLQLLQSAAEWLGHEGPSTPYYTLQLLYLLPTERSSKLLHESHQQLPEHCALG